MTIDVDDLALALELTLLDCVDLEHGGGPGAALSRDAPMFTKGQAGPRRSPKGRQGRVAGAHVLGRKSDALAGSGAWFYRHGELKRRTVWRQVHADRELFHEIAEALGPPT